MGRPTANRSPVQSVSRFVALLRELNRRGPLSIGEMARITGIPYPTTGRIVQTMVCQSLIERVPDTRSYRVAAMALSLSHGFQSTDRLAAAARPAIEALTARIGWPMLVMARVGTSMVTLGSTHHLTPLSLGPCPEGTSIPVLHSASGHVFLAFATQEERLAVLDGLQRYGKQSPMLSMFVEGRPIERIRDAGYATFERNAHTQNPGRTSSISVPIHDCGRLAGTLTLVLFVSAMPISAAVERFLNELWKTATTIEDALADSATAKRASGRAATPEPAGSFRREMSDQASA